MTAHRTLLTVALALAACGGSSTRSPDSGVSIDASGQTVDAAPTVDADHAVDGPPAVADAAAGSPDAAQGPDAAAPTICGGFAGFHCDGAHYCDFPDNICGGADGTGVCLPVPDSCPADFAPVCACDGNTYGNECQAQRAGQDLNSFGGCPPPEGTFNCGTIFCQKGTQYCKTGYGGAFESPPSFNCMPIPATCGNAPACDCLSAEPCGDMCTEDAGGNFTLTCLYP